MLNIDFPSSPTIKSLSLALAFLCAISTVATALPIPGQDPGGCGGVLTDLVGLVTSPQYPRGYPTSVRCLWQIAPNVTNDDDGTNGTRSITFVLDTFETQTFERLLMYTADPRNGSQPYRTYSGKLQRDQTTTLTIPDVTEVWIRFESNGTQPTATPMESLRFRIAYASSQAQCDPKAVQNGTVVPQNATAGLGLFQTAEFHCNWGYRMVEREVTTGTCQLVSLDDDHAMLVWSHLLHCLASCAPPAPIHNGTVTGSYDANSTLTYSCDMPYRLEGPKQVPCRVGAEGEPEWEASVFPKCSIPSCQHSSTPAVFAENSGALVNPSYPSPFVLAGGNCQWTVQVEAGNVVSFNFSYLDLPYGAQLFIVDLATSRYLLNVTVGETELPNPGKVWYSSGNSVKVSFLGPATNSSGEHRGFYLAYNAINPSLVPSPTPSSSVPVTAAAIVTTTPYFITSEELTPSKTTIIGGDDDGGGGVPVGSIVAGIVVPIVVILIALYISYKCYRRRFPVRMIVGRDFNKFSNPAYPRPKSTATLVREMNDNQLLNSQMQPDGIMPGSVSFLPGGGPDQELSAVYVNVGYIEDSGDAEEESEADRLFRLAKSYLFKYEDDIDSAENNNKSKRGKKKSKTGDQNEKDDLESLASDDLDDAGRTSPAKKKGGKGQCKIKGQGNSKVKGHDNPAFSGDSDDGRSENEEETAVQTTDTEKSISEVSLDVTDDEGAEWEKKVAKPRRKRQAKTPKSPPAEEKLAEEYDSRLTVQEYMKMIAQEKERARERAGASPEMSLSSGRQETSMTVKEFLKLARERQRAQSDVVRARADSLTQTYDVNKMSARRRAQSAGDVFSKKPEEEDPVTRSESADFTPPVSPGRRDNLDKSFEDLSHLPDEESQSATKVQMSPKPLDDDSDDSDSESSGSGGEYCPNGQTSDDEEDYENDAVVSQLNTEKSKELSDDEENYINAAVVSELKKEKSPEKKSDDEENYENVVVSQLRKETSTGECEDSAKSNQETEQSGQKHRQDVEESVYENAVVLKKSDVVARDMNQPEASSDLKPDDAGEDNLYANVTPQLSNSISSSAVPARKLGSTSPTPAIQVSKPDSGESEEEEEDDEKRSVPSEEPLRSLSPRFRKISRESTDSLHLAPPMVATDDRVKYIDSAEQSMLGSFVVLSSTASDNNSTKDSDDDFSVVSVKSGSMSSASDLGQADKGSMQNMLDFDDGSYRDKASPDVPRSSSLTDVKPIYSIKLLKGVEHSDSSSSSSEEDSGDEQNGGHYTYEVSQSFPVQEDSQHLERTSDDETKKEKDDVDGNKELSQQAYKSDTDEEQKFYQNVEDVSFSKTQQSPGAELSVTPPSIKSNIPGVAPTASKPVDTQKDPPTSSSPTARPRGFAALKQHFFTSRNADKSTPANQNTAATQKTVESPSQGDPVEPAPLRGLAALRQLGRKRDSAGVVPPADSSKDSNAGVSISAIKDIDSKSAASHSSGDGAHAVSTEQSAKQAPPASQTPPAKQASPASQAPPAKEDLPAKQATSEEQARLAHEAPSEVKPAIQHASLIQQTNEGKEMSADQPAPEVRIYPGNQASSTPVRTTAATTTATSAVIPTPTPTAAAAISFVNHERSRETSADDSDSDELQFTDDDIDEVLSSDDDTSSLNDLKPSAPAPGKNLVKIAPPTFNFDDDDDDDSDDAIDGDRGGKYGTYVFHDAGDDDGDIDV